jgi:hypothetical protein
VNVPELAMIQNGSPARKRLNHESAGENDAAMLHQKRDALDGSRTVGKQEVIQLLPARQRWDRQIHNRRSPGVNFGRFLADL